MVNGKKKKGRMSEQPCLPLVALFSARLRQWRQARGIQLKRVAADLGVSVSVVSAWEQGVCFPSAANLEQLSAYSGVPVWQFFYSRPVNGRHRPTGFRRHEEGLSDAERHPRKDEALSAGLRRHSIPVKMERK